MVNYHNIRAKLQNKLFSDSPMGLGKIVTFKKRNTPTYNDRGEISSVTYTDNTIYVVPYNVIKDAKTYQVFGDLKEGEMDLAVPYNVDVTSDDAFYFDNTLWLVKQVAPNYLTENVVTIVRIVKQQ